MSEENNTQENNQKPEQVDTVQEEKVSLSDVKKITEELAKYKKEAAILREKFNNQEIEAAKAAADWQKVAELKEKESLDTLEKLNSFKQMVVMDKKISAIREEAIKAGIRKEAIEDLSYLDYPEVKLQTNDEGRFLVDGVDRAIQRLKSTRAHWFKSNLPEINSHTPTATGTGEVTMEQVQKLQAEYRKNPNKANEEKLKGALIQFRKKA